MKLPIHFLILSLIWASTATAGGGIIPFDFMPKPGGGEPMCTPVVTNKGFANLKTGGLWTWAPVASISLKTGDSLLACVASADLVSQNTWKSLDAGSNTTCAIRSDDSLWCWGSDAWGMLGDDTSTGGNKPTPVPVTGGFTWKQVSVGQHTCAIRSDDTLWCWGSDSYGKLGDNASISDQPTPAQVSGGGAWKKVSVGGDHTCAIKSDDTLWCWGRDAIGTLGNDSSLVDQPTPVAVAGGGTWKSVSAAGAHTCGIKSDDSLWCWGDDLYGELGNGANNTEPLPVQVGTGSWKSVNTGRSAGTCGIMTDNTLWCWGIGNFGANGIGTGATVNIPTQVSGTWKTTDRGFYFGCAIDSYDSLWCWGEDTDGQLGNDSALVYKYTPVRVAGPGTWKAMSTGDGFACGIKNDDTLWCWGRDNLGQLGDNATLAAKSTPVTLQTGLTWNGNPMILDTSLLTANGNVYVYSLINAPAGTGALSVNFDTATSTSGKAVTVSSVSGLRNSGTKDQVTSATATSTTPSSGSVTTTQAQEFLFGCIGTNGPVENLAGTWSNSFNAGQRDGTTGAGAASNMTASEGYLNVSSTGSYSAAKTGITSRPWMALITTYKAAACP